MKRTIIALLCASVLPLAPITALADTQNSVQGVYQLGRGTFIDTSDDGVYVTADMSQFTNLEYSDLSYVNGTLFAEANEDEYTVYSKDGINFTPIIIDGKQGAIYDIMYFKNRYLAFCDGGIVGSDNGGDWRFCSEFDGFIGTRFVYKGNLFFIENEGDLYTTSDALRFSMIPDFEEKYGTIEMLYNDTFMITGKETGETADGSALFTYYVSNDGQNFRLAQLNGKQLTNTEQIGWSWIADNESGKTLSNVLPENKPIRVDDIDEEKISDEYYLWERFGESVRLSSPVKQFTAGGKGYLFGGSNAGDGYVGWANVSGAIYSEKSEWIMGDFNFQDAASDGRGQFIITGDHGAMLIGSLTKNGGEYEMTITAHSFNPDGSGIHMLKYANGMYFIGTFSGGLYSSADGLNWEGIAAMPTPINDIIFANNSYYAACDDGVYSGADGKKWSRAYQTTDKLLSLAYGQNKIVACGGNGTIITGTIINGKPAWSKIAAERSSYDIFYSAAFGNGVWIISGGSGWGGSGVVFRSTDGSAWMEVHDGKDGYAAESSEDIIYANTLYAIKYIGGHFVGAGLNRGSNGCILTGSADGLNWEVKNPIYYWGLDVFEPLPGLDAVINSYGIYIDGKNFDTWDIVLNPNNYTKLIPKNIINPAFTMPEVTAASNKT
jgi:hypothetical protein